MANLFLPTYVKKSNVTENDTATKSSSRRVLPSTSMPTKRSLLPPLVFNGNVEYIQTFDAADRAGRAIEAARPGVLGFDIEWQVSFVAGQAPRRTATLQLCAPDRAGSLADSSTTSTSSADVGVWSTAFIFHLCHMRPPSSSNAGGPDAGTQETSGDSAAGPREGGEKIQFCGSDDYLLPDSLVRILSDPGVLLVGVGIGGDVSRLEKEYPQLRQRGVGGVVCLSEMAKRKAGPEVRMRRGMWSLSDLCAEMLNIELPKPGDIRTSNWERRPLSVDQLFYAAADAYAGLRLWQEMQKIPDAVSGSKDPLGHQPRANDDDIGGRSANSSRLSSSKVETHRMWHEDGLSVEAIGELRSNTTSTVLGYLSDCVEAGLPYVWERFKIDPETQAAITRVLTILAEKDSTSGNDFVQRPSEETVGPIAPKEDEIAVGGDRKAMNDQESTASRSKTNERQRLTERGQGSVIRQCRDRQEREKRLGSVKLKDVKDLVPHAEYWQIRLVLARFRLEGGSSLA